MMNINELYSLAKWYISHFDELNARYSGLSSTLTQNANQQNQRPIEDVLERLVTYLSSMNLGELSMEQLALLAKMHVEELIGPAGARHVTDLVKTTTYDPASTASKISAAHSAINVAKDRLVGYLNAVDNLGVTPESFEEGDGPFIVRIGFRNEAAIENIKDWKNSSDDWYHIIRGLALASGEAPEETKVVGVATGSIILILATTCAVTALLATIFKHITSSAKEVIILQQEMENLRKKKILNEIMAGQFEELVKNKRADALEAIHKELSASYPSKTPGDVKAAIEKSVEKLLKFGEKGGDLDIVVSTSSPETETTPVDQPMPSPEELQHLRKLVQEYQENREAIKLIGHYQSGDN